MKHKNIHILPVRIPLHLLNAIEKRCIETGQTRSQVIRQLIEKMN